MYDIAGPRGPACVRVDPGLAAPIEAVTCFWDLAEDGARIGFWAPDQRVVASFPGWDHADCEIARLPEGWMPLAPPGSRWEDLDATWYLATQEVDGWVYLFQTDLDLLGRALDGVPEAEAAPGAAAGLVLVNGVEATWYRIPVDAFREAWATAQGQARRIVAGRGG